VPEWRARQRHRPLGIDPGCAIERSGGEWPWHHPAKPVHEVSEIRLANRARYVGGEVVLRAVGVVVAGADHVRLAASNGS
jgi:hypothetical protein